MNNHQFECLLTGHIWQHIIYPYSKCTRCDSIRRSFNLGIDSSDNVVYRPGDPTYGYHLCKMVKLKEKQGKEVKRNREFNRFQELPIEKRFNKLVSKNVST